MERSHDNFFATMECKAESLVRGHGSGKTLFKIQLAITVILLAVSIMTPYAEFALHEEYIRDGHQYRVVIQDILYQPLGDKSVPFSMECVRRGNGCLTCGRTKESLFIE
jgi:hypothetical protein